MKNATPTTRRPKSTLKRAGSKKSPAFGLDTEPYLIEAHTIECGLLHSGLPPCCVSFYVTVMGGASATLAHKTPKKWGRYVAQIKEWPPSNGNPLHEGVIQYIPCPRCYRDGMYLLPRWCMCRDFSLIHHAMVSPQESLGYRP
jgi:hypothetical protein